MPGMAGIDPAGRKDLAAHRASRLSRALSPCCSTPDSDMIRISTPDSDMIRISIDR
jgi:hypothetical protein